MTQERRELSKPGRFVFDALAVDAATGRVALPYAFDTGERFVERLEFGPPPAPLDQARLALFRRCLAYAHAAAGVSYYKALLPPELNLSATDLDSEAAAFLTDLYEQGLGEFAHVNALDLRGKIRFTGTGADLAPLAVTPPQGALVPVGGGKDSLVTVEAARRRGGRVALFAVNPKGPILGTAEASGLLLIAVRRHLDPALFALNEAGAWNGHVPITAIVSLIALAAAVWHGFDTVVMSNERSASTGNLTVDGFEVNHQYSKGAAFERALQTELARAISPGLRWFSLLRPWGELAIAERFAAETRYDAVFSSCNRNFHLQGDGPARLWCRDCPKCRFVFLALAPFMPRARLLRMFGGDLFADINQLEGFAELAGLQGHKPFECVGEIEEAQAALAVLSTRLEWRDAPVLAALEPRLAADRGRLLRRFNALLEPEAAAVVPADWQAAMTTADAAA